MTTHPFAKNARYAKAYGFEGMVCPPGVVLPPSDYNMLLGAITTIIEKKDEAPQLGQREVGVARL